MTTPSWYPDPMHRHELRWWDGASWTAHVNDHGTPAEDPLFGTNPEHSGWAPPTVEPSAAGHPAPVMAAPTAAPSPSAAPVVAPVTAPPPTTHGRRTAMVVGGIVAVLAIGVGVFFATRDKGGSTSLGDATTAPPRTTAHVTTAPGTTAPGTTAVTTTLATSTTPPEQVITTPETTAPTTAPPTTRPPTPTYTNAQLAAALTQKAGVPSTWVLTDNAVKYPSPHSTGGACNGPNEVSRALANNSVAETYGPSYKLPNGGWFGVDAYSFETVADAEKFIAASGNQAAKCVTTPVLHRVSEKDIDVLTDPKYDSAVWTLSEGANPRTVAKETSEHAILISRSIGHVMKYNADTVSYRSNELTHYERYGALVLVFWRWGNNHHQGFSNYDSSWDFTPTNTELMYNVRLVRGGIVAALS